jgi:dihydrofolate synthase/folylpolyglutamate synthase
LEAGLLKVQAAEFGLNGESYLSVKSAYDAAIVAASGSDLVFVGGSVFTVAEVL